MMLRTSLGLLVASQTGLGRKWMKSEDLRGRSWINHDYTGRYDQLQDEMCLNYRDNFKLLVVCFHLDGLLGYESPYSTWELSGVPN